MARVVQQIKLLVNGEPTYCVYMGTKDDSDSDITGGSGHLVVICPGGEFTAEMLAHGDGTKFDLNEANGISKIKVQDAYRINEIPYATIIPDIVREEQEE